MAKVILPGKGIGVLNITLARSQNYIDHATGFTPSLVSDKGNTIEQNLHIATLS